MKKQGLKILVGILVLLLAWGLSFSIPVKAGSLWREFRDTEELAQWLDRQPIFIPAFGKDNNFQNPTHCVYIALRLQERALIDGYLVSVQLVEGGRIFGTQVINKTDPHMGMLATMGNDIWYFEKIPIPKGGYIVKHVAYVGRQD